MIDLPLQTFFVETLGCQMNKLDSELVAGGLIRAGLRQVDRAEEADLAILNTCSVREHAEDKALSRVGHWHYLRRTTGRPAKIAMVGCFAQRAPDHIRRRAAFVDIICGPGKLPSLIELSRKDNRRQPTIAVSDFQTQRRTPQDTDDSLEAFDATQRPEVRPFQAYVRVQRGCDNFCSYCIVPYVRGPEHSRPIDHILDEARQLDDAGCKEITLLGQAVSSYHTHHKGQAVNLADVLRHIHDATSIPRIRFVTSYPGDFPIEIFDAMAELDRICPYLHLPAQHGSNRMLKLMNRKYTIEQYLELIDEGKRRVPAMSLAGDFICGFPGEADDDHRASMRLLEQVRYKNCFVFKYSPRPGTVAAKRYADDIPDNVKSERVQDLLNRQATIAEADNQQLIGKTLFVLVEGHSKKSRSDDHANQLIGRTVEDKIVVFDGPESLIGQIAEITIDRATALTLFGRYAPISAEA